MPLDLGRDAPTLLIRKAVFERAGLSREELDRGLNLTPDEFRVEGALIAIGPLFGSDVVEQLIERLEMSGLIYFDDFFELSGNWPEWLRLLVMGQGG